MMLAIIGIFAAKAAELAKQLLLLISQVCRRNDSNLHMLIALTIAPQLRYPLALQPEVGARLCTRRHLELNLLRQGRNLDFIA
ncbi:hypothetical protein D3C80_2114550 [compost metagenome]